jgi:transcriptional regulator with XRE-family HTH domain
VPTAEEVFRFIGANTRRARLKKGLTQEGLSEAAGLDLRFLQRIERGETNLSVAVLVSLGGVLGLPLAGFFRPAELPPARRGRPPGRARRR